jgi:hypothetical protein
MQICLKFKKTMKNSSRDFLFVYKNAFSFIDLRRLTRDFAPVTHWGYAVRAHHVTAHYQLLDLPLVV